MSEQTPQSSASDSRPSYKKRSGTTDLGRNYVQLYIANLALKLMTNNDVEDYSISHDDVAFCCFDDVVVEIKYHDTDQPDELYAIKLKYSNRKPLTLRNLETSTGGFSIMKYLKDLDENLLDRSTNMILLTNAKTNFDQFMKMKIQAFETIDIQLSKTSQNSHIANSTTGDCYSFNSDKREEFFQTFFLYTNQYDVDQLEKETLCLFQKLFYSEKSVFFEYLDFITKWTLQEGRIEKLNKKWMMTSIFLQVASPFIKSLSFSSDVEVDKKEIIFRDAVSQFDIVSVNKSHYEDIKLLWKDGTRKFNDLAEANKVKKRYQLTIDRIEDLEVLNQENKDVTKLMWLLGVCPLIVEGCQQVYNATQLCQQTKLIILDDQQNFQDKTNNFEKFQPKTFQKLSDLKPYLSFEDIFKTFTYSLEGQQEVGLNHLIDLDEEFAEMITTNQLVQMLKGPLFIGQDTEKLPPCYIERKLSKTMIDPEFLENLSENTIVTISHVKDPYNFGRSLPDDITINNINEEDILYFEGGKRIYISEGAIKQNLFLNTDLSKIYHFRYSENKYLECLNFQNKRKCIEELQKYRIDDEKFDYPVHESQLFNNINILCADPGMGKSTLMRSLKKRIPSSKWSIIIHARNHVKQFGKDFDKFFESYFNTKFKKTDNKMEYNVFRKLMDKRQICIFWDGLDDIPDDKLEDVFTMVDFLSKYGVTQWLSSRKHLKAVLEERFSVFAQDIKEFDEEEQVVYAKNRLGISSEECSKIFEHLNRSILDIPLQIYMLTELLSSYREKNLDQTDAVFTILDLYEHFIHEKFKTFYVEKLEVDESVEIKFERYEEIKQQDFNYYKEVASVIYLDMPRSFTIEEIVNSEGLFVISNENTVEFLHKSFGEYFAALFLFEKNPEKARDISFISNSKYKNVRFFLDLMLSKKLKAFVAVLHKNVTLLNQCTEDDFNQKDVLGRDVLEVAFPWTEKEDFLLDFCDIKLQDFTYENINNHFIKIVPFVVKKLMYLAPFLIQLYDTKREHFNRDNSYHLLYFAIKFDYPEIFDSTLQLGKTFKKKEFSKIIYLILFYKSRNIFQKMIELKKISTKMLFEILPDVLQKVNGKRDDILLWMLKQLNINLSEFITLHIACQKYNAVIVKLMIDQGEKLDIPDEKGQMPIHCATENTYFYEEIIKLLLSSGVNLELADSEGERAIHYACRLGKTDVLQLLIDNGGKIDIPDAKGQFPIHKACYCDDISSVQLLIKTADLNIPDVNGDLPIHIACQRGHLDVVKLLIKHGSTIDVKNKNGDLPIHKTFEREIIKFLINIGAEINIPDSRGEFLIHKACDNGETELVKLLISKGAEINVEDFDKELPIHKACLGDIDIVRLLIENGAKLNAENLDGEMPIHKACYNEEVAILKLLLELRVKINVANKRGELPIHIACASSDIDVVKLLLKSDASIDIADNEQELPIHKACINGRIDIVELLISKGARIDIPNKNKELPIHKACQDGHTQLVKFLISLDPEVNKPDANGELPIHKACSNWGNIWLVKLLMDNNADINKADGGGNLPLHKAATYWGNVEVIQMLLDKGVDVNACNNNGDLPIHVACSNWGNLDVVQLLLDNNAKLDVPNVEGELPIHKACEDLGNVDVVQFLIDKGSRIDVKNNKGELNKAVSSKKTDIVQFLKSVKV